MSKSYSLQYIFWGFFLFITCTSVHNDGNYFYLSNSNITQDSCINGKTFSVIKYFHCPLEINDSAIFLSVAYVWEYNTGDTIRILFPNSQKSIQTTGIVRFNRCEKIELSNRKIFVNNDSIFSQHKYKSIFGTLTFLVE